MTQSKYVILWEDPRKPDAPIKITIPAPQWMKQAMLGLFSKVPMTEEEAVEYLIQKDLPPEVWRDYRGNRQILKIVPRHLIPNDRMFRNAWRINQKEAA